MRSDKVRLWLCGALLLGATACNSGSETQRETGPTGGDGKPAADHSQSIKINWSTKVLDSADAGEQTALAVSGNTVGIAYYRAGQPPKVSKLCKATIPGQPDTNKDLRAMDVMYVQSADGAGSWGTPVKIDATLGEVTYDLSVAMGGGKVHVGYLGGEMGLTVCASSDMMLATSSGGASFTAATLLGQGPIGDTVGYWPAVAVDSKGAAHAAFADVRYGFYEQDAWRKGSLRYDATDFVCCKDGSGYPDGLGWYNSMVIDPSDTPIIASYNPAVGSSDGGLLINIKKGGTWSAKQLLGGSTKEKLGLARSSSGVLGLAYYDPTPQQLGLLESDPSDPLRTPWKKSSPDTDAFHTGEHASIAYDSKGNPAISYYKCGPYNPSSASCDATQDGLRFVWRADGKTWSLWDVDKGGAQFCGDYTSLGFVNDQPVIAYRCVTYNSATQQNPSNLKVAKGVVQ